MTRKERLMRRNGMLAAGVVLLCVAYLLCRWAFFDRMHNPAPEIAFGSALLEVSVNASHADLLKDVTATDEKDGDVTKSLVIESLSPLMDNHVRVVTYAAFDGDNQVGKAQRKIRYADYTPIRFGLTEPLFGQYSDWDIVELLAPLRANSCLDGDLTSQIVVTDWNWALPLEQYRILLVDVQVTNSGGEVAELTLPIPLATDDSYRRNYNAEITLSDYLVYHAAGEPFDPYTYIKEVTVGDDMIFRDAVDVETDMNPSIPGVYTVTYSLEMTDSFRNVTYFASCDQIVVVE